MRSFDVHGELIVSFMNPKGFFAMVCRTHQTQWCGTKNKERTVIILETSNAEQVLAEML